MVVKVLIVLDNTDLGGNEQHALNIIEYMDKNKYETHVLVTTYKGRMDDKFKEHADRYVFCGDIDERTPSEPVSLDVLRYISSYVEMHGIDVAHLFNGIQNILGLPADFPKIMHMGGDFEREQYYRRVNPELLCFPSKDRKKPMVEYLNSAPNTLIVSDCENNAKYFTNYYYYRNFVPQMSDYDPKTTVKRGKTVAWVGRDTREKHPEMVKYLAKVMPDYTFNFVVATPARDIEMPDNVKKYVNVTDKRVIHNILLESSVFINTSDSEGYPISITEARQNGCFTIGAMNVVDNVDHQVIGWNNITGYKESIEAFESLTDKQKTFYRHKAIQSSREQGSMFKVRVIERLYDNLIKKKVIE